MPWSRLLDSYRSARSSGGTDLWEERDPGLMEWKQSCLPGHPPKEGTDNLTCHAPTENYNRRTSGYGTNLYSLFSFKRFQSVW